MIYKHKVTGEYLRPVKARESGVNSYLEVDKNNTPIIKKRSWCCRPTEQRRLVKGFKNLTIQP